MLYRREIQSKGGTPQMKYGPEKTLEICINIEQGNNRTDTCLLSDISYETFTVWMQKPEFSEAIKKAEAKFKSRCIGYIRDAALKSWQAAAWLLERKYYEEYALKQKIDQNVSPDAALRMAETTLKLMRELNANGTINQPTVARV